MSQKIQNIIIDIPQDEVLVGIPVGYNVEFSLNKSFVNTTWKANTYDEDTKSEKGIFYYSLDNGATWIDYPLNDVGQIFYNAYKIKLTIPISYISNVVAIRGGIVYKIGADCKAICSSEQFAFDLSMSNLNIKNTDLSFVRNKTLYFVDSVTYKYKKTINLLSEPFDIAIDDTRNSFWQIDGDKVYLKDFNGITLRTYNLPSHFDIYYSSSSSTSSNSSSSSSSLSSSSSNSSSSSSTALYSWSSSSSSSSTYLYSWSSSSSTALYSWSSSSSSSSTYLFSWSSSSTLNCFCSGWTCGGDVAICAALSNWNLTGMTMANSTNCKVWMVANYSAPLVWFTVYKEVGKTTVVATTNTYENPGTITFNSVVGLGGTVDWDGSAISGTFTVECIPS